MKRGSFLICLLLIFVLEAAALIFFAVGDTDNQQDAVAVNEAVQSVQNDWGRMENHRNQTDLDYVVLDGEEEVLFQTKPGLSNSVNAAIVRRDTILDLEVDGSVVGKIIICNDGAQALQSRKQEAVLILGAAMLLQWGVCIGYAIYLNRLVIKPFQKLQGFAERIAGRGAGKC